MTKEEITKKLEKEKAKPNPDKDKIQDLEMQLKLFELAAIDWSTHEKDIKELLVNRKYNLSDEQVKELFKLKPQNDFTGVWNALSNFHDVEVRKENKAPVKNMPWYYLNDLEIYDDIDRYSVDYYGEYLCESGDPDGLEAEFEQYQKAIELLKKWLYESNIFHDDKYRGMYFIETDKAHDHDYSDIENYYASLDDALDFAHTDGSLMDTCWWRVVAYNHETNEWDTFAESTVKYKGR